MGKLQATLKVRPALVTQFIQVVLGLLISFQIIMLSENQTAAILSFVAAATGFVLALEVRPFAWPVLTSLIKAGLTMLAVFGFELTAEQAAAIYSIVSLLEAFVVQQLVTPETKFGPVAVVGPSKAG